MRALEAAARLAGCRGRVVLHSGRDDDGLGGWSFVAAEPIAPLIAHGHSPVALDRDGRRRGGSPAIRLAAAEAFLTAHGCSLRRRPARRAPRVGTSATTSRA